MFGIGYSISVFTEEKHNMLRRRLGLNEIFCIMMMSLLTETAVATVEH
jgi:hypothetical protein